MLIFCFPGFTNIDRGFATVSRLSLYLFLNAASLTVSRNQVTASLAKTLHDLASVLHADTNNQRFLLIVGCKILEFFIGSVESVLWNSQAYRTSVSS